MAGGVVDGQAVSAAVTNPAFLDANGDDTAQGKIGFADTDPVSGTAITNIQREANSECSFTGKPVNSAKDVLPSWTHNDVGLSTDDLKTRADNLTAKFNATTGHKHTGAAGDAPRITASDLASVPLRGYVAQGSDLSAVTGTTHDVSTELTGKTASAGSTSVGVVVSYPNNKIVLRQASGASQGDDFLDTLGNVVFGRLTFAASVWTLSFLVDLAGVETAYNFLTPVDIRWYYQELFNPMVSPPVYSEFATIPSDNVTSDVITATTSQQGKTQLASSAPGVIAATGAAGTANAVVANSDHTHEGTHSVKSFGGSDILGDVVIQGAGGSVASQASQTITITSPSLGTATPQPVSATASAGSGTTSSKVDHVHAGVHGVNTDGSTNILGDVQITGSGATVVSQLGQIITVSTPGLSPYGSTPADVAATGSAGASANYARGDHAHKGVHSLAKNGDTALFGDVTVSGGSGITITRTSNDLSFAVSGSGTTADEMVSTDATTGGGAGNRTVVSGTTWFHPNLSIATGDTVTVNSGASYVGAVSLVINGTMIVNGTSTVL